MEYLGNQGGNTGQMNMQQQQQNNTNNQNQRRPDQHEDYNAQRQDGNGGLPSQLMTGRGGDGGISSSPNPHSGGLGPPGAEPYGQSSQGQPGQYPPQHTQSLNGGGGMSQQYGASPAGAYPGNQMYSGMPAGMTQGQQPSNPIPQLQQLMMLLQQNQNLPGQNLSSNMDGRALPPNPQSQSTNFGQQQQPAAVFGSGLMQAAQILAQSHQQTSRFEQVPMQTPQPQTLGGEYDAGNMLNQSMHGGYAGHLASQQPPSPYQGYQPGQDAHQYNTFQQHQAENMQNPHNTTLTGTEIQQHLGMAQNQQYQREQPRGELQHNPSQQWLNGRGPPQNQYFNNYMTGGEAPGNQGFNWQGQQQMDGHELANMSMASASGGPPMAQQMEQQMAQQQDNMHNEPQASNLHYDREREGPKRAELDFRDFNDEDEAGREQPRSQGVSWLSKLEDGKEKYSRENQEKRGSGIAWPTTQQQEEERKQEEQTPEAPSGGIAWPSSKEEEQPKSTGIAWHSQKEEPASTADRQYQEGGGQQRRHTYDAEQVRGDRSDVRSRGDARSRFGDAEVNSNSNTRAPVQTQSRENINTYDNEDEQFFNKSNNQMDLNGSQNSGTIKKNLPSHQMSDNSGPAQKKTQFNHRSSKGDAASGHNNSLREDNLLDENTLENDPSRKQPETKLMNAIDDIPIPVSKPKTFEELLEEEMRKGNGGGITAEQQSPSRQKQTGTAVCSKKEFLRRKSQYKGIPTGRPQSQAKKQYRYYIDNFKEKEQQQQQTTTETEGRNRPQSPTRKGSGKQGGGLATSASQRSTGHNKAGSNIAPTTDKPDFNQWNQLNEEQEINNDETKSPNQGPNVKKRKFLARGSGNAGGGRGLASNQKTPARSKDQKSPMGHEPYPQNDQYAFDQPDLQNKNLNSIDDFKNLEDRVKEQNKNFQNTYLENQKRNQKLFEDDSDEDDDQPNNKDSQIEDNRSNLVKKMFYKDGSAQLRKQSQSIADPGSSSGTLPTGVQKILDEKKEQLDKAMKYYNQELAKLNAQKIQTDTTQKKLKLEQRELEQQKKKQREQFDKTKEEEMEKIRQQKKIVEQRQKNIAMANNSSKRDREEIESLRKQLTQTREEAMQKEKYQKAQIDRLTRQVGDLRQENTELRDEIANYDEQLRDQRERQFTGQQVLQQQELKKPQQSQIPQQQVQVAPQQVVQQTGIGSGVFNKGFGTGSKQGAKSNVQRKTTLEEFQRQEDEIQNEMNMQNQNNQSIDNISEVNENQQENQSAGSEERSQQEQEEQDSEGESEDYEMKMPARYHGTSDPANTTVQDQVVGNDGKIQRTYLSGKKEVIFSNGVRRETFPDGYTIVFFNNHDIKQTYPDQKIVYYFAEAKTTQTTYADGLQVFKFSNNQIEKHFGDGTKEIIFPDGTIKCIFADGEEESIFTDGTIQRIEKKGVKAIEYASGQKDILFPDGTRVREYPDGRVKKTYPDGRTENSVKSIN